jgi:AcrR family transcriptional regulator
MDQPAAPHTDRASRPQRADARANRSRILQVADEVFGTGGEQASTEEVARLAGVGHATVFRHFPTKAALLEAVFVRRLERLRDQARALADAADPGRALFGFFAHTVADAASKLAIADALTEAGGQATDSTLRASDELRRAVGVLLRRAQQAGAVRDDIDLPDLYALLIGTSRAAAYAHLDDKVRDRAVAVIVDGLAPQARKPHDGAAAGSRRKPPPI